MAPPTLVGDPPISRDLFTFVIMRLSPRGEKGLVGEGGSIEFFRLTEACEAFKDCRVGDCSLG